MGIMTRDQELAILEALWDTWVTEPPTLPDYGDRLFIRYVDMNPEDPSWEDWRLVGVVSKRKVSWNMEREKDTFLSLNIEAEVCMGQKHGYIKDHSLLVEWGLFVGDGPEEPRVSDWATPSN